MTIASALALAVPAVPAIAQTAPVLAGTRLDVVATGEVSRVPDVARISAGVVTAAPTASAALEQNARQMESVRAALKRAGIADRDIQTSSINLFPDYRQDQTGTAPPQIVGYRASNDVSVRFRDIRNAGKILDALVAQGANQINGPALSIDQPEAALDEARTKALDAARKRADLYARALGKRVGKILSVSEGGGYSGSPMPMMSMARVGKGADTSIDPGEQTLSVSLSVSFELE
ncbi:MAG: DUF541 domain-containing protein [Alphaproteobacteria bacterium]|nr:MAG: DUF541 domain-containing protein [Alphaproteobacteria bacterium]